MLLIQPLLEKELKDYQADLELNGNAIWYSGYVENGTTLIADGCFEIIFYSERGKLKYIIPNKQMRNVLSLPSGLVCGLRIKPEYMLTLSEAALDNMCRSGLRDINLIKKIIIPNIVKITSHPVFHKIVGDIAESRGEITVYTLAEKYNYSERHINSLVKDNLGYGPKDLARYVRFQNVLKEMLERPNQNNSDYIQNLSYSDQAHFQREFKQFMGMTPRNFIKKAGQK